MIQTVLILQEIASHHDGDVMMAWIQYLPAILSAGSAIYGGLSNARKQREMREMVNRWNAENEYRIIYRNGTYHRRTFAA